MNTTKNNFLIDKQTAINILHTCLPGIPLKRLNEIFAAMPPAQPERKKGRWIKGGEQPYFRKHFDIVVCSICNKRGDHRWNFCPNCGADMRGEEYEDIPMEYYENGGI